MSLQVDEVGKRSSRRFSFRRRDSRVAAVVRVRRRTYINLSPIDLVTGNTERCTLLNEEKKEKSNAIVHVYIIQSTASESALDS